MAIVDDALLLASHGFRVFPLARDANKPWRCGWQQAATTAMKQIEDWFVTDRYNIGIACGEASNLTVIDIDQKHGVSGFETLLAFKRKGMLMPPSPIVVTPSGGQHLYYQYNKHVRNWCGRLGPGIDIKTEGGFVVGPGSHKDCGDYKWLRAKFGPLPEFPQWIIKKLVKPKKTIPIRPVTDNCSLSPVVLCVARQKEGARNNVLYWAAWRFVENGYTFEQAVKDLLPAGLQCGLDENSIIATIRSAYAKSGDSHRVRRA